MSNSKYNTNAESWTARQARFSLLCDKERLSDRPTFGAGIGTYKEKRLHAILKDFYCPEGAQQEVKLTDGHLTGKHTELTDAATRRDRDRYVADIMTEDGDIIVLAGKGHEDYQEIKGVKYHMDERELIAEIIAEGIG